ncbi:unnamed protein product [Vicia faba]|uniref:Uncharacterized protein n=1 Tax=Vicia faba TaxID=3906 RepID=A0AAV0ZNB9_VICFA|nr:unnamed protein product [Vicia faba]
MAVIALAIKGLALKTMLGDDVAALMPNFAPKIKVLRDGKLSEKEASILDPSDIISSKLSNIIPADHSRSLNIQNKKFSQAQLANKEKLKSLLLQQVSTHSSKWLVVAILDSGKTRTFTYTKLLIDINLIEVFIKGMYKEHVIPLAARLASFVEANSNYSKVMLYNTFRGCIKIWKGWNSFYNLEDKVGWSSWGG